MCLGSSLTVAGLLASLVAWHPAFADCSSHRHEQLLGGVPLFAGFFGFFLPLARLLLLLLALLLVLLCSFAFILGRLLIVVDILDYTRTVSANWAGESLRHTIHAGVETTKGSSNYEVVTIEEPQRVDGSFPDDEIKLVGFHDVAGRRLETGWRKIGPGVFLHLVVDSSPSDINFGYARVVFTAGNAGADGGAGGRAVCVSGEAGKTARRYEVYGRLGIDEYLYIPRNLIIANDKVHVPVFCPYHFVVLFIAQAGRWPSYPCFQSLPNTRFGCVGILRDISGYRGRACLRRRGLG